MNKRTRYIMILVLLALTVAAVAVVMWKEARAGSVSLCNMCAGYRVSAKGDDVLVRCPPYTGTPWLTITDCPRSTKSIKDGNVVITCYR